MAKQFAVSEFVLYCTRGVGYGICAIMFSEVILILTPLSKLASRCIGWGLIINSLMHSCEGCLKRKHVKGSLSKYQVHVFEKTKKLNHSLWPLEYCLPG